ncbi:MAG: hypothetical protein J6B48_04445 [Clostridia bacterium]|nr:hypothetical protein [Clostridia bacterium]
MYRCEDKERLPLWKRLEDKVGSELTDSLKSLYDTYDQKMVEWMASLYDDEIGGWYFSKSAQQSEGYLPDIESTIEALDFINSSGMSQKPYGEVIPDWLKHKVAYFVNSLQAPDGYFYHPQWGREVSNLRKSRDVDTAMRILKAVGAEPKYLIPISSAANSSNYDINNAPERFRSKENYLSYIESLDILHRSYNAGSEMLSQLGEIHAFGKMLEIDFMEITMNWLDKNENSENGLWQDSISYYGVNGLHKISWIYNSHGRLIPYADNALDSAIEIVLSDKTPNATVDLYNPWHAIGELRKNKQHYSPEGYEAFVEKIYAFAVRGIKQSKEKIIAFKKPDGGLSYLMNTSTPTAQGAPIAVPGSAEGDVNGTLCGSVAMINSIYTALGIEEYRVPMFGENELYAYIGFLEKKHEKRGKSND